MKFLDEMGLNYFFEGLKNIFADKSYVKNINKKNTNSFQVIKGDETESEIVIDENVQSYETKTSQLWSVMTDLDKFVVATRQYTDSYSKESTYTSGMNYSDKIRLALPVPINGMFLSGSGDRNGQYISDTNHFNNVGCTFRIFTPANVESISTTYRLLLAGARKLAPSTQELPYDETIGSQIIELAKTYVTAQESGRKFNYGENFFYGSSNKINDENGAGMVECDTYVGLVLRGIPYNSSPYTNTSPNYEFQYSNLTNNPNNYDWCAKIVDTDLDGTRLSDNIYHGRDLKYVGEYAWLMWAWKSVFTDISQANSGDLVFFKNTSNGLKFFDNISHVGIIEKNADGTLYIYEATTPGNSDGKVIHKIKLSDRKATPCYFARIKKL